MLVNIVKIPYAYSFSQKYGAYRGQIPMQMAVGQPVPGGVPTVAHGGSPGYSVYSGAYAAASAADPLWTFFNAIAGQVR